MAASAVWFRPGGGRADHASGQVRREHRPSPGNHLDCPYELVWFGVAVQHAGRSGAKRREDAIVALRRG
jgi:hypothetical protein